MPPAGRCMMKKIVVFVVLVAAVAAYSQRAAILTVVMARGLDARMNENILSSLDDGLHVALCGAGGPMPAPNASGPCVAVVAGDHFTLWIRELTASEIWVEWVIKLAMWLLYLLLTFTPITSIRWGRWRRCDGLRDRIHRLSRCMVPLVLRLWWMVSTRRIPMTSYIDMSTMAIW